MIRVRKASVNSKLRPVNRIHRPYIYIEQLLCCSKKEAKHLWEVVGAAMIMQLVEQGNLTIDGLCRLQLHRRTSGRLSLRTINYKFLTNLAEDKDSTSILKDILSDYQIEILKAKYNGALGAATWITHTNELDEDLDD